jgi:hypothetical protein
MKSLLIACLLCGVAGASTLTVGSPQDVKPIEIPPVDIRPIQIAPLARSTGLPAHTQTPLSLIGVMAVPAPITSTDLLWVDEPTGRVFLTDRTNRSIDIFDAGHDRYVTRVTGFFGVVGGAVTSQGPNGLLVTPDNKLWVADGMATMRVADLDLDPPALIRSFEVGPASDGRADELAYDPVEHLIAVGFDAARPPYVAIIDADTYQVLNKIQFTDATGMEQPVWNGQLHRFLINVPGSPAYIAVVDPVSMTVTKKFTIPRCNAGTNGLALGPAQRLFVYGCGRALVMNAIDGHIINDSLTQIGTGGDEVWYNPGDNRFYVTSLNTTTGVQSLNVVDAGSSTWVQSVPAVGIRNVAAYAANNHVYSRIAAPAAGTTDTTLCASFGVVGTGCIAVFAHSGS